MVLCFQNLNLSRTFFYHHHVFYLLTFFLNLSVFYIYDFHTCADVRGWGLIHLDKPPAWIRACYIRVIQST